MNKFHQNNKLKSFYFHIKWLFLHIYGWKNIFNLSYKRKKMKDKTKQNFCENKTFDHDDEMAIKTV